MANSTRLFFANAAARAFPRSGALAWLVQYVRS
jgi:hypothetical protein